MTAEKAIEILSGFGIINRYCSEDAEALDMAIKALEQQPCEDCISREAVLDILKDKWNMFSDANDAIQESIDTIEALSPVTPQPKIGEWVKTFEPNEAEPFILWECSNCHKTVIGSMKSDYCPNCGARMKEGEDEE